jgi:hypothetical protein
LADIAGADSPAAVVDAAPDVTREAGGLSDAGCFAGLGDFPGPVCVGDGICWERPLPFGVTLDAIWGVAANDVWAVGAGKKPSCTSTASIGACGRAHPLA